MRKPALCWRGGVKTTKAIYKNILQLLSGIVEIIQYLYFTAFQRRITVCAAIVSSVTRFGNILKLLANFLMV